MILPLTRSPPGPLNIGMDSAWLGGKESQAIYWFLSPRQNSDWATHCDLIVVLLALDLEDCDCVEIVANNLWLFAGDLVIQSDRELPNFHRGNFSELMIS